MKNLPFISPLVFTHSCHLLSTPSQISNPVYNLPYHPCLHSPKYQPLSTFSQISNRVYTLPNINHRLHSPLSPPVYTLPYHPLSTLSPITPCLHSPLSPPVYTLPNINPYLHSPQCPLSILSHISTTVYTFPYHLSPKSPISQISPPVYTLPNITPVYTLP